MAGGAYIGVDERLYFREIVPFPLVLELGLLREGGEDHIADLVVLLGDDRDQMLHFHFFRFFAALFPRLLRFDEEHEVREIFVPDVLKN